MIRTLNESDEKLTIVAAGPLSNLGMALRLCPAIADKIERICVMGGAYGQGNYMPGAEFNVLADPEAAHVVFSSGVPVVMMGLDVTNRALADRGVIERMVAIGNRAGKLFGDIMSYTLRSAGIFGLEAGPVHDVPAMAYTVAPDLFTMRPAYVEVCLDKGLCYGRTECDFYHVLGKDPMPLWGQTSTSAVFGTSSRTACAVFGETRHVPHGKKYTHGYTVINKKCPVLFHEACKSFLGRTGFCLLLSLRMPVRGDSAAARSRGRA